MVMVCSYEGDKHNYLFIFVRFKHVRGCPSFDIIYK